MCNIYSIYSLCIKKAIQYSQLQNSLILTTMDIKTTQHMSCGAMKD